MMDVVSAKTSPELSEHTASAICYFLGPITGLFFLTVAPYSRNMLVRFHAWQSILASSSLAAFYIAVIVFSQMLPWVLLSLLWFLVFGVLLGSVVLWFYLIVRTLAEERLVLPVLGALAEDFAYRGVSM
jgi:uncharacterized membrane protein